MATTTSMLKTTSTTSVLVALAFMNSTMSNTTKVQLPVTNYTIDVQPNCFRQQIECPFSLSAVKNVSADVRPQMVDKPVSSSTTPALQLITTGANSSAVMDFGHISDFSRNLDVGPPTTGLFSSNHNGTRLTESTTETTFKTVDDVRITAEVVYDDETSSSEYTTTTTDPDVSYTHSYDEMIENSTVGLVTAESMAENSIIDLVTTESTITNSMDVSFDFDSTTPESSSSSTETELGETMLSESVESMTRMVTESTLSLDAIVMMANTTIDQPIITTIDDNDEPYSTTSYDDLQFWRTDERIASSKERRIVKRTPDLIFNGTHCFQIVCSSPLPDTNVTEVPNGFQGFSEESSK